MINTTTKNDAETPIIFLSEEQLDSGCCKDMEHSNFSPSLTPNASATSLDNCKRVPLSGCKYGFIMTSVVSLLSIFVNLIFVPTGNKAWAAFFPNMSEVSLLVSLWNDELYKHQPFSTLYREQNKQFNYKYLQFVLFLHITLFF